ncbi:MAG: toprim domain-containing protein [Anaerolineae bacterium]|nr:toprim domain-containing protein [Anaerolineae bacterium]NUQ06417.1 toprim domain-containing protein [Anaerolineae bacterium]
MTFKAHVYPARSLPDLRELVARYWGEGRRSGRAVLYRARWRSGDDTPSFAVYADGYKDFGGSGESGGVIQWIMREFGFNSRKASEWLEKWYIGYSFVTPAPAPLPARTSHNHSPPSSEWQHHLRAAVRETQRLLWSDAGRAALDYLRQERGLTDETIRAAELGYAPDYMKTDFSYQDEDGASRRVSIPPGIVIPWDMNGVLWAVRVRSRVGALAKALNMSEDHFNYGSRRGEVVDKYRSARGSRPSGVLYGAENIGEDRGILFFEGEFDALLAGQQLHGRTACVTFGSASNIPAVLPEHTQTQLRGHHPIYVAMDADAAGQNAAARLRHLLPDSLSLPLPPNCKDITEYAQAGGDIRAWFTHATTEHVPDSWSTALLHMTDSQGHSKGAGAPVYHTLIAAINTGRLDPQDFTLNKLLTIAKEAGYGIKPSLARTGIRVLLENGFLQRFSSDSVRITDEKVEKKPGGRPADRYRLVSYAERHAALVNALSPRIRQMAYPIRKTHCQVPTIADLTERSFDDMRLEKLHRAEVEAESEEVKAVQFVERRIAARREKRLKILLIDALDDSTFTPLPEGWQIETLALFRAAFLRALKLAGKIGSRLDENALVLGITRPSVNKYVLMAGFRIERDQTAAITLQPDEPVEAQVKRGASALVGKPIAIEAYATPEDIDRGPVRLPYTAGAACSIRQRGALVRIVYQTANLHIPILDARQPDTSSCRRPRKQGILDLRSSGSESDMGKQSRLRRMRRWDRVADKMLGRSQEEDDFADYDDDIDEDDGDVEDYAEEETQPEVRQAGYTREWMEGQMRLRLELLGWRSKDGTQFISRKTGEVIPYNASLEELIELLVNKPANAERRALPKWRGWVEEQERQAQSPPADG